MITFGKVHYDRSYLMQGNDITNGLVDRGLCTFMAKTILFLLLIWFVSVSPSFSQVITALPRQESSPSGSRFAEMITGLDLEEREDSIFSQVACGNIPGFLRKMVPVTVRDTIYGDAYLLTYYVLADYLSVGSDSDFLRIPMTPLLAQEISNLFQCSLPTVKMVDDIYRFAPVKLTPHPIPPGDSMITVPVFLDHNRMIYRQMDSLKQIFPAGTLTAGHKKDVVITNCLIGEDGRERVAIYGWHRPDHTPIQPLYTGHLATWVDYSHGIRLISNHVILNGEPGKLTDILQDPLLSPLVSNEGVIRLLKYPVREQPDNRN